MAVTPTEILALTNEPAVFVQRGKAVFANAAAQKIFADNVVGKSVCELFGKDISGMQASGFISNFAYSGKKYIVRVSPVDKGQIFFLSPHLVETQLINDTVISILKNDLTSFNYADEWAMEYAEKLGSKELCRYLSSMNHSMMCIIRLIRNISVVRDSNAGDLVCCPSVFDLDMLCKRIVTTIQTLKPDEDIRYEHGESVLVDADAVLIEQLILNLISNSIIHAKGHEVISLNIIESANSVIISVSDDGCGIEADQLTRIFERYRYDFDLAEMSAGAGLGLNTALCIAEQHKGTLMLESRPGRGTTVRASIQRGKTDRLSAPAVKYETNMRSFLADLSSSLPDECFSWRYIE